MDNQENTFHIGLCMAGAISAGAYTAGVMDYLIEALEDWESRRGQPGVPTHRVMISVMGGASAGGMTGIVTAAALSNPIERAHITASNLLSEQPQNPFYHSWVDLTQEDMFSQMLDTDDIKDSKIYSLLNSKFIDQIAERSVAVDTSRWVDRNYIRKNMHVFSTLTNLEGFCSKVQFRSAGGYSDYLINRHNDYGCFILNPESGSIPKGWMALDFRTGTNLVIARQVAMATGAFPVGLRSRRISRPKHIIDRLEWLKDKNDAVELVEEDYNTLNVDGGMINNEPFERVREILMGITGQTDIEKELNNYRDFESTVLMIDPFPSKMEEFDADDSLFKVIGSTFSAMLGQLRTKPSEIRDALSSNCAGQYLIAPVRYFGDERIEGSKAIACGTFGGFGGFLNKEFRIHDYFLGRDNCESFLMDHFSVPESAGNPIFVEGYRDIDKTPFSHKEDELQIIPIFKTRRENQISNYNFFASGTDWPSVKEEKIDAFRRPIKNRIQTILMNLDDYNLGGRILVWLGAKAFLNKKLTNGVMGAIKKSLREYGLLR